MKQEELQRAIEETVTFFCFEDRYDENYIIRGMLEILKEKDDYTSFAEQFHYIPAEMVFFFKLAFGEQGGKTKTCLQQLEYRYRIEVAGGRVSIDMIRESVTKAGIIAMQEGISFQQAFAQNIIKPNIDKAIMYKRNYGKRKPISQTLYLVLEELSAVGIWPQNLFVRQITT